MRLINKYPILRYNYYDKNEDTRITGVTGNGPRNFAFKY